MVHTHPGIADIISSRSGNENSLLKIMEGYKSYINLYSMYTLRDGQGKEYRYMDDDCRQYIYIRVLSAIRQFNPNY